MNLVYLHSHDTGRAIQPYGYPVATPHLQALASASVLFRDAHCAAPTCSPSRAALLTGRYAHEAGMFGLAHRGNRLRDPGQHLASWLGEQGYATFLAGIQHVGSTEVYQAQAENDKRDGQQIVASARDFLKNRDRAQPFFLDAGFVETHRTEWFRHGFSQEHHNPTDGDGDPRYVPTLPPLPDHPDIRRDWLDYTHSAERLDDFYGQILQALAAEGLDDETIVLVTTDHGVPFPFHKCELTAGGTGVLMMMRLPDGTGAGRVVDSLVSHVDIFPTLCELLGKKGPDGLVGTSLLPLMRDEAPSVREEIFAEVTFHAAFEPKRNVRTRRWNYIRNFAAPHLYVRPNCDDSLSKRYLLERGLADRAKPVEELYDLTYDPFERHNLATSPALATVLADLRRRLATWMTTTDDPLLHPDPATLWLPQTVNGWDQVHPGREGSDAWDTAVWTPVHQAALTFAEAHRADRVEPGA